jgi:hypothetical protein
VKEDFDIQPQARRLAWLLAAPSWLGFVYTLLHRPVHVEFGNFFVSLPEFGFIPILTLVCSLIGFLCSIPSRHDNWALLSTWLFPLLSAIPFFGMVWVLDPLGFTSAISP